MNNFSSKDIIPLTKGVAVAGLRLGSPTIFTSHSWIVFWKR